ncbi:MAG TPA: LysM peptidoglycan-binding domain-containing protein [Gammaproteobacteria bacterium]
MKGAIPAGEVASAPPPASAPEKAPPVTRREPVTPAEICKEPHDIWVRIRHGFVLPDKEKPGVEPDQLWFARHQEYLTRVSERATPYMHYIVDSLEARGMPTELALLPVVESAFQPFAYSHGRAAGLWQFIPGTGSRFGLRQNWWYDGRRDVALATTAALDYLQELNQLFEGDWLLSLAAYNAGEGTVKRAIARNQAKGLPTDFWSLELPKETRGYVPKLLAISNIVANPPANGVVLPTIPDEPFLSRVEVGSQIDLALAAELAELSMEEIYRYNPGFNRWATDPDGPHHLMLPIEKVALFEERLKAYPESDRISWNHHSVKKGETLSTIAKRYGTTPAILKSANHIKGSALRVGQGLLIPVSRGDKRDYALSADARLIKTKSTVRGDDKIEYVVRSGDTLWGIARQHNVSPDALAQWNGMAPRDPLKSGMTLVVWRQGNSSASAARSVPDFVHPMQESTRQRIGYTVRRGDTLSAISQRFRVSVDNLKRWNKLNSKHIRPGQKLTLYVDVTAQSGRI